MKKKNLFENFAIAQFAVDGNTEELTKHGKCEFCNTKKAVRWNCFDWGNYNM